MELVTDLGISQRIPDELAEDIGAAEAHVVVPFGKGKVCGVEIGLGDDGAFLGRGWREFAAACGVGVGWLLVLRHHGGGVLTVKAFDDSGCLRGLPAAGNQRSIPRANPPFLFLCMKWFKRNRSLSIFSINVI
jgi:hypothetical protein